MRTTDATAIDATATDATATGSRGRTALRLAGDLGIGLVWLIVVIGTVAAWFGIDVLGGLFLGSFLDEGGGEGPGVVVAVGGLIVAMTFAMSVVWRRGRGDGWFLLLWILMAFLLLGGVAIAVFAFASATDPGASDGTAPVSAATRILLTVGYSIPLAGSLLAMLVASKKVFPTWGPVGAGVLAAVAEALGIGIWVVLTATFR
jgi:hypothetical protein